ncbi:MAG: transport-related membrane protein [Burkholderiales bacterium]|nr:MAG: transport-related membrane protein [Burkholderiales bacterium]
MAFGGFQSGGPSQPIGEINMIPLIDVMLVLLIIFIITAPLLTHAVKIDLPKASSHVNITRPEHVQLGIRSTGEVFWNGEPVDRSALERRLEDAARLQPQPELHLRADASSEYRQVAEVLSLAAKAGLTRIGFVTDPRVP